MIRSGRPRLVLCAVALLATAASDLAHAVPEPIKTPPIPAPAQLSPAPRVRLVQPTPPGPPDLGIPEPPNLDRLPIPPEAAITPADSADTVAPPAIGLATPAPPTVSPGASGQRIQESLFILDPDSSTIPPTAETKLRQIARDMSADPAARLEVRVYSPIKARSEGTARRLSLSRFLAVRSILKDNGVSEGRVDGRPLASAADELNADRVELYIER